MQQTIFYTAPDCAPRMLSGNARQEINGQPILEISSRSPLPEGKRLSAFNLELTLDGECSTTVESAYQGSKVFADGSGPFSDLLGKSSWAAKKDPRIRAGHRQGIVAFRLRGQDWPTTPKTAFYDWLYISALQENPDLAEAVLQYRAFTDTFFSPSRMVNCQARAAALYVHLTDSGKLEKALESQAGFLQATA